MTSGDKAVLIEEIYRLQKQIGHLSHYNLTPWLDLELTIGQLKSLFFINMEGITNLRKLATALGVSPPNMTGIVDRLVEQGLVSRDENPEDRRMLLLRTTEKGKTMLARLQESGAGRMTGILTRMSEEELACLAKGLSALARAAAQDRKTDGYY